FLHAPSPPRISPLSLHDALPICNRRAAQLIVAGIVSQPRTVEVRDRLALDKSTSHLGNRLSTSSSAMRPSSRANGAPRQKCAPRDRKSTRLNSSHRTISYAVFCL